MKIIIIKVVSVQASLSERGVCVLVPLPYFVVLTINVAVSIITPWINPQCRIIGEC